jgi:hypothetical protein
MGGDITLIQNTPDYLPIRLGQKKVGQVASRKAAYPSD